MTIPLDGRQLKAFATLAKTGSFTKAARELYLSQSAVSHSMKALEQDVGCRLLDRVGKTVLLTQAGEQLLQRTEKILKEMGEARQELHHLGKWGKGRLRIGASTTACQHILPSVLGQFKTKYADCNLTIEPADTSNAMELLRGNKIDLAVALEPKQHESIDFHPLFEDELQFLVGALHAWALDGKVQREEVPKQNYILYKKSSYTFMLIADYFREEKMVLNTCIELGSMEAIKELVKLNLGVGILAPWIARKEIEDRSIVPFPLGKRKLKRNWGIMVLKDKRLSLPEETFINLCHAVTKTLVKAGA